MTEDGSVGVIEAFRRAIGPLVTHGDSTTYNFLIGGKRGV